MFISLIQNLPTFFGQHRYPSRVNRHFFLSLSIIYQNSSLCILNCIPSVFPDSATPPDFRVIIIGMGRMGESLLVHLVKRWKKQYGRTPAKKIRITIIDKDADDKKNSIIARYRALNNYCDIDNQKMELNSSKFYEAGFLPMTEWTKDI